MFVFGIREVPDFEFLGFRTFGNTVSIIVTDDAYSEFDGFHFSRILIFRITAKIPNLPGYYGRNFFLLFGKQGFIKGFR